MALIDELAGSLSPAVIARIKAKPDVFKEVIDMYYAEDGDEKPEVTTQPTVTPTTISAPPSAFSLADIESALDKRLGVALDERIKTGAKSAAEELLTARANEVVIAARTGAVEQADQLMDCYTDWNDNYSEGGKVRFPKQQFKDWVVEQQKSGKVFKNIPEAYETFTAPQRTDKTVNDRVREELKNKKTLMEVPGVTPASARSPLSTFINRGKTTDKEGTTAAQRAGAALDEALARRGNLE